MTDTEATDRIVVARTRSELTGELRALRDRHATVSLVPTMGALHEGHTSLIDRAKAAGGAVVVSIFVNPTQFAPGEDFDRYPRNLDTDLSAAQAHGADLVFAPPVEEMYPDAGPTISVDPGEAGDRLCGAFRPGHFRGVLTVVAKLFGLMRPERAVFGRKDFQQSVLVRKMVADLDMGVEIDVAPTVREADGLALSSRNAYLTPAERSDAARLSAALFDVDHRFREGETDGSRLLDEVRAGIARSDHLELQYLALVDPDSLHPVAAARRDAVVALAAFCGGTRLIDNIVLGGPPDPRVRP